MNRIKKLMSHLVVFMLLVTLVTPTAVQATDREYTIIHTNDMHGRMDSDKLARLKTFKDDVEPILMLDGGDAMQGLPLSNISKGAYMARVMNAIGYDAMAVGNHEFDFGQYVALGTEEGFGQELNFPLLSSNTYRDETQIFKPSVIFGDGGDSSTSTIIERDGLKIPIVGATTPETLTKTHPNNIEGLHWKDPLETVTAELLKYEDKNPEFYVVVTHLGTDKETKEEWRSDYLAKQLSLQEETKDMRIVIVDGHSHSVENQKHGNVILVQTGEHLNNVGVVTINLDDWTKTDAELIKFDDLVGEYEADPVVLGILEEAQENFEEYGSRTLIEDNTIHFNGLREHVRTRETNLGNAIADSIMWYAEDSNDTADLAVVNGGGIRADIVPGKVTLGDVIATLPFGNIYSLIEVTGQDIIDMFEHSIRTTVQVNEEDGSYILDDKGRLQISPNGGFLHTSEGVKLLYDPLREPGDRIVEITLNGEPINPSGQYKLATNDFLAVGGDGYTMLGGPRTEGPSLDVVFADYLNSLGGELSQYADDSVQTRIIKTEYSVEPDVTIETLQAAIKDAEKYVREDYTEESYAVFEEAYNATTELVSLIEDATARRVITQEDVDTALVNLQTAIEGLVDVEKPVVINATRLEELLKNKDNYKKADYTENSYKVYTDAIKNGESVLDKLKTGGTVTQADVDTAVKDIENAIAALVKVKKEEGKLPGTGMAPETIGIVPVVLIVAGAAIFFISKRKEH